MTVARRRANVLVRLGSRGYDLIKKSLGLYGTAVALVQLLPAVVALLAVAFTPTALLSPTLRRWLLMGTALGSLVGMAVFASRAGLRTIHLALRGSSVEGKTGLGRLARAGLATALAAAALLRLHLAVVDTAFIRQAPFLTPVFDFYLSGGAFSTLLFNAGAALLAGVAMAGAVAGAPAALLGWREAHRSRAAAAAKGGPLAEVENAIKALDQAAAALKRAREELTLAAAKQADGETTGTRQASNDG